MLFRSGSIEGFVHLDTDGNCELDSHEQPLAGVTIQLLDVSGRIIATTETDAAGHYQFAQLTPGTYQIREIQPTGMFHGGQDVGSGGGDASIDDLISEAEKNRPDVAEDELAMQVAEASLKSIRSELLPSLNAYGLDRKSTRLNSSH